MDWPIDEFISTRRKVTMLCFISLLVPSFMLYHFIINVRQGNVSGLIFAICVIHIYVSLMYSFPRLFTRYMNIFMLILGEETMAGKGFDNNKQRIMFVITQGIAAASIVEISRWLGELIVELFPTLVKNNEIGGGIIYSVVCTTLVTFFLWIGITRVREKGILREHWGSKRLLDIGESV